MNVLLDMLPQYEDGRKSPSRFPEVKKVLTILDTRRQMKSPPPFRKKLKFDNDFLS